MAGVEIRVLGPAGVEDYHAHLLRLDPRGRSLCLANHHDNRGIDGHCLRLLSTQAILIGAYAGGALRASLEVLPDRTARHADAVFTAETGFGSSAIKEMLIARLLDEARSYRLSEISLRGIDDASLLASNVFTSGVEIVEGTPMRLRFCASAPIPAASTGPVPVYA